MEIRSGVGGEESSLFAHDLFRMYSMYAESKGWKIDIVNINETELGGIKEMSFVVEGQGAYSRLKFEAGGGHRVQRVPETGVRRQDTYLGGNRCGSSRGRGGRV